MICNVILYYTLVFSNGIYDGHVKYMDNYSLPQVIKAFQNKEFLHENNINAVVDIRVEHVNDFDCSKGPINWVK